MLREPGKSPQKFYLPAGADDDSDDTEDEFGLCAKTTTVTGAYSNLRGEVVKYRAATSKLSIKRDGSMTAAEKAETEFDHVPHNVLAVGEITARLPGVDFRRKRYYSEKILVPGIYDVVTDDDIEFRLIMEKHPANDYWSYMPPVDMPRDFTED